VSGYVWARQYFGLGYADTYTEADGDEMVRDMDGGQFRNDVTVSCQPAAGGESFESSASDENAAGREALLPAN